MSAFFVSPTEITTATAQHESRQPRLRSVAVVTLRFEYDVAELPALLSLLHGNRLTLLDRDDLTSSARIYEAVMRWAAADPGNEGRIDAFVAAFELHGLTGAFALLPR